MAGARPQVDEVGQRVVLRPGALARPGTLVRYRLVWSGWAIGRCDPRYRASAPDRCRALPTLRRGAIEHPRRSATGDGPLATLPWRCAQISRTHGPGCAVPPALDGRRPASFGPWGIAAATVVAVWAPRRGARLLLVRMQALMVSEAEAQVERACTHLADAHVAVREAEAAIAEAQADLGTPVDEFRSSPSSSAQAPPGPGQPSVAPT